MNDTSEVVAGPSLSNISPSTGRGFLIGVIVLLVAATVAVVGVISYGLYDPEWYKSLGTWGDFTGGLLNPVLTFITFIAVLLTLWLQSQELSLTRDETRRSATALEAQAETSSKQSFENTFFEMLRLHNSIVDSIDLVNPEDGRITRGRDAFVVFYTRLTKIYRASEERYIATGNKRDLVELSYYVFWKDAKAELSHYFRFLFNLFRFIERSKIVDSFYVKLLRSQLSDQELLLLFYNNIAPNGEPFAHFADLYGLFDNLPVERLLDRSHASLANKKAFGANPMDFRPKRPRLAPKPKQIKKREITLR